MLILVLGTNGYDNNRVLNLAKDFEVHCALKESTDVFIDESQRERIPEPRIFDDTDPSFVIQGVDGCYDVMRSQKQLRVRAKLREQELVAT